MTPTSTPLPGERPPAPSSRPCPFPPAEDAVLGLRCELVLIEALIGEVLPPDDVSAEFGLPRQPHHQLALVPHDERRAMFLALIRLRAAVEAVTLSTLGEQVRAAGVRP